MDVILPDWWFLFDLCKGLILLKMDFKQQRVEIRRYSHAKFEQANKDYLEIELSNLKNKSVKVVLISMQDIKELKQSYPNYFMDTTEFIENLEILFQISELKEQSNSINDDAIKKSADTAFESILSKMNKLSDGGKK